MVQTMKYWDEVEAKKLKVAEAEALEMKVAAEAKAESDYAAHRAKIQAQMEASDLREVEAIEVQIEAIGKQLFDTPREDHPPLARQRIALRQRLHSTMARIESVDARRIAAEQTPTD